MTRKAAIPPARGERGLLPYLKVAVFAYKGLSLSELALARAY